jgi:hypothetical protein
MLPAKYFTYARSVYTHIHSFADKRICFFNSPGTVDELHGVYSVRVNGHGLEPSKFEKKRNDKHKNSTSGAARDNRRIKLQQLQP